MNFGFHSLIHTYLGINRQVRKYFHVCIKIFAISQIDNLRALRFDTKKKNKLIFKEVNTQEKPLQSQFQ